MSDLSHIVGSCYRCSRTDLRAVDFFEHDLRNFLASQTSNRGFKDARGEVHSTTKRTEVAGQSLFCRQCVEAERTLAAAADSTWNEDDASASGAAAAAGGASADAAAVNATDVQQQEDEVADCWDDDDD